MADMAKFVRRKWEHKCAVWSVEGEDPQIRTPYVPLGAFTVLQYATVIVYRWSSLWTRVMTYCMKWIARSAMVEKQDEGLGRS
jgi:hypothetical protein